MFYLFTPNRFSAKLFFMSRPYFFRLADFSALILFGFCAWLQFNDPDSLLWITLYGSMAGLAFCLLIPNLMPYAQIAVRILRFGLLLACVLWAIIHWPWNEEEWREVGGLGLLTLWLWWRNASPANQTEASEL